MEKELWREVPGYDRYESEAYKGKVRSKNYRHSGKPKELKPFYMHRKENKYFGVNLWKDGNQGSVIPVHRIIALTFPEICGEWFEGAVVNHKDCNPENNSAFNLEVCTVAYNSTYGNLKEKEFETKVKNGLYCGFHSGTTEYREYWNKRNALYYRHKISNETPEEKEIRLAKRREYRKKYHEKNKEEMNRKAREKYRSKHPDCIPYKQ